MRDYRQSSEALDEYPLPRWNRAYEKARNTQADAVMADRHGHIETGNVNYTFIEFIKSLFGVVPRRFR